MIETPYSPPVTETHNPGIQFREKVLKAFRGPGMLPLTVLFSALTSFGTCVLIASILLGNAGPAAVVFGLSSPNLAMTLLAGGMLFVPTLVTSLIVYVFSSVRRRWVSLIPAAVLPLLGGCGFFVFVASGLG